MREILFRAKHKEYNQWVEGDLIHEQFGECIQFVKDGCRSKVKVDPETVCQYTGLTDKNGRKIFEGDIVRLPKCENDIAVFTLEGCNYFLKGKRSNYVLGSYQSECYEVVGNIFDNPELLKGDAE